MIRLELLCSPEDREGVIDALRPLLHDDDRLIEIDARLHPGSLDDVPVHERVTGRVTRILLLLEIDDNRQDEVMKSLGELHLRQPLRWSCQPIVGSGVLGE